jgi:hypothetical protein
MKEITVNDALLPDLVAIQMASARLFAATADEIWQIPAELVLAATTTRAVHLGDAQAILSRSMGPATSHDQTVIVSEGRSTSTDPGTSV